MSNNIAFHLPFYKDLNDVCRAKISLLPDLFDFIIFDDFKCKNKTISTFEFLNNPENFSYTYCRYKLALKLNEPNKRYKKCVINSDKIIEYAFNSKDCFVINNKYEIEERLINNDIMYSIRFFIITTGKESCYVEWHSFINYLFNDDNILKIKNITVVKEAKAGIGQAYNGKRFWKDLIICTVDEETYALLSLKEIID
jgi:hypothetical protein